MTKRMLIDATHAEETRVVVLDGQRLEDFDVETSAKKQLKGNIYLAKIVRVEPSLQAAFVEYGGGRHGFLAFGEIHPDYYQIPVADRQRLLAMQAEEARAEAEADDVAFGSATSPPSKPEAAAPVAPPEAPLPEIAVEGGLPQPELPLVVEPLPEADQPPTRSGEPAEPETPDSEPLPTEGGTEEPPEPEPHRPAQAATIARDELFGPADVEVAETPVEPLGIRAHEPPTEDPFELSELDQPDPATPVESFRDIEAPVEAAPPPETVGGDPESGEGAEDARRRRESRFLRQYRIQEVIKRRQIMLIQVVKEERGTKGAALTTYISLAGRFSVLMPNSPRGGGISRKITSAADRRRLKEVTQELDLPQGMGLIVRTAGANRPKAEIKRDCEYLMRLWDDIRDHTMRSMAPALIYEEASLIKRAIRDVYSRDIDEIVIDGEAGWRAGHDFMRMIMPSHAKKVQLWRGEGGQPLFAKHAVEAQLDAMLSPTVQLKSGGYLVINQTEALVAVDVNSGRSTRERNIEETAFRTNLEAADEAARQLRLRDLAGLIVIDFIDMESRKNNAAVERRLKEALKIDRARIQVGSISHFGLLEMSRQRLRPSVTETSFVACPHCGGTGHVRSTESAAIHVLREIEDEGARGRAAVVMVHAASSVVMFLLNHKRDRLTEIEARTGMRVQFAMDESLTPPQCRIDRVRARTAEDRPLAPPPVAPAAPMLAGPDEDVEDLNDEDEAEGADATAEGSSAEAAPVAGETKEEGRRRRRRRRRGGRREEGDAPATDGAPTGEADVPAQADADPGDVVIEPDVAACEPVAAEVAAEAVPAAEGDADTESEAARSRRRGRRGGRRRRRDEDAPAEAAALETPAELAAPAYVNPVYVGPTPADPFGNVPFDIFDLMDAEPATRPARASAVEIRSEPPAAAVSEPEPMPVPETQAEAAPEPEATALREHDLVPELPLEQPLAADPEVSGGADAPSSTAAEPAAEPKRGWWRR